MNEQSERVKHIKATLEDMVTDLLYYDRKEDEDLPVDAINEAVEEGEIAVDEMVAIFREHLVAGLGG